MKGLVVKKLTEDKKLFLDYLMQVYGQCNTHLLEQGKKRDQVVSFYVIVLSFILTNLNYLKRDFLGRPTVLIIYATLMIAGGIVILILADLRSWHTQYLGAIYTINWAIANQKRFETVDELQAQMKAIMEDSLNGGVEHRNNPWILLRKYAFGSTDNMVYTGIVFLVCLPIFGIIGYFNWSLPISEQVLIFLVAFSLILYGSQIYLAKKLKQGETYNTWILSFDYNGKVGKDGSRRL